MVTTAREEGEGVGLSCCNDSLVEGRKAEGVGKLTPGGQRWRASYHQGGREREREELCFHGSLLQNKSQISKILTKWNCNL